MKNRRLSRRMEARFAKPARPQAKNPAPAPAKPARPPLLRWLVLALSVLLVGGGTWAAAEFFLFSKLPPELVGKWVVQGGPQDGATFDFTRGGSMVARLNHNGELFIMTAQASVEGKRLLTTTKRPSTGEIKTSVSHIRELTRYSLVLESEEGEVTRMTRAE